MTDSKRKPLSRSRRANASWQLARVTLITAAVLAGISNANAQALCQVGTTAQDYVFTGGEQSYVVPPGVDQIAIQAFGAQGNGGVFVAGAGSTGGLGGSASGTLDTAAGQSLYVYVGGQGNSFNGGGSGGVGNANSRAGGNGGGASDVRAGGNTIGARVIVAGGGGGGGGQATNNGTQGNGGNGGAGGGDAGGNGANGLDAPTVTGGGGQGGQAGVGGAQGVGCSFAAGTPGNGTTGLGGNGFSIPGGWFAGAGGGGGGGDVVGGGGGGGTAGTVMCTLNDTGAGGGGAGGTSAAFAGISGFASSNGVRSGNGFVRLCIPATAQNLSFSAQPGQTFSLGGTFSISPLADNSGPHSSNPILYSSVTPGVCTVSGTTVSMVSPGTCTLEARQAGDTVYTAATPVSQSVLIASAPQNLSFSAQPDQTFSPGGTFAISPLAVNLGPHSGNPILYSSVTPGVCTVSGTTVSMVSPGTCTLEASQAGDTVYAAATPVSQSVLIASAPVAAVAVPTLGVWGLLGMGLLILGAAGTVLRPRRS